MDDIAVSTGLPKYTVRKFVRGEELVGAAKRMVRTAHDRADRREGDRDLELRAVIPVHPGRMNTEDRIAMTNAGRTVRLWRPGSSTML